MDNAVSLQIECNPYLTQKKLIKFCQSRDITVTAYSPMGSPDSPFFKAGMPRLLQDPNLQEVARRVGKSVGQVVLRYLVSGSVTSRDHVSGSEGKATRNFIFDSCWELPVSRSGRFILGKEPLTPTGYESGLTPEPARRQRQEDSRHSFADDCKINRLFYSTEEAF